MGGGRTLDPRAARRTLRGVAGFWKVRAHRRRLVMPTRRLRAGSLPLLPMAYSPPFVSSSYSHLVPRGSNPVSPKPSVAAGHGTGIDFGFPGVHTFRRAWAHRLGNVGGCECDGYGKES